MLSRVNTYQQCKLISVIFVLRKLKVFGKRLLCVKNNLCFLLFVSIYVFMWLAISCHYADQAVQTHTQCIYQYVTNQSNLICTIFCFFVRYLHVTEGTAVAFLAIAILSVCLVTRVDQSKTMQARITKSSLSAAWKTLVSGFVKLFHKFLRGHPQRWC